MRRTAALFATTIALLLLPTAGASADTCQGGEASVEETTYEVQVCTTERYGCTQVYVKIDGQVGPFGGLYTRSVPDCP